MTGYRWHCRVQGCTWTGADGPAILAHHQETGHTGTHPYFEEPELVPPPAVPPPLFRKQPKDPWTEIGRSPSGARLYVAPAGTEPPR